MHIELKLHPNAEANFNQKAEELVGKITPGPEDRTQPSFIPDFYIAAHFDEANIIGEFEESEIHPAGHTVSRFFRHNGSTYGLHADAYKDLARLTEKMQETKALRTVISRKSLERQLFAWVRARYRGEMDRPMCEFVLGALRGDVSEWEVWIPIAFTCVESDLAIGPITFKTITPSKLSEWSRARDEATAAEPTEESKKAWDAMMNEYTRLQGYAAACITLIADMHP